jgi:hypothetical protein
VGIGQILSLASSGFTEEHASSRDPSEEQAVPSVFLAATHRLTPRALARPPQARANQSGSSFACTWPREPTLSGLGNIITWVSPRIPIQTTHIWNDNYSYHRERPLGLHSLRTSGPFRVNTLFVWRTLQCVCRFNTTIRYPHSLRLQPQQITITGNSLARTAP